MSFSVRVVGRSTLRRANYFLMGPRAGLSETSEYGKVAPLSQGFSTCEQQ